ncbi:MAG: acyl-CoA thioesterase [Gaiellaceae bacterium]
MDGFPFVHRESVRFRDLDGFGHVNNAVYLTYMEEARNAFLAHLGLARSIEEITMILARAEVDFRAEATVGETVEIGVRPSRFGTKSFDLEYELRAGGRLVAEAKTVLVAYDYGSGASIEIPDEWRRSMAA